MPIIYKDNEQIVIEIKKLMLENKISQREIADKMNIKPQGLTKILNKKNFGFEDAKKILSAMGYDLVIDFQISHPDQESHTGLESLEAKLERLKQEHSVAKSAQN